LLDSLGTIIKIVSNVAPGGTLVFFTSYSTRDKLLERIESNGFLNDLQQNGVKICIEPKDNNELKSVINNYKTAISSGRKAIMFCVFKGKISEGISFSDSYCRSVIMIGIPYGNTQDRRSSLKKEFQDIQSRNNPIHINGSKWYSQQAYRAINQAVGRVIRHRLDWGSILLVDQRYCHAEHYGQLSKWLRGNVQIVNNFEDGIIPLNLYYSSLISDETFNGKSDIDPITIEDEDEISKVANSTITKSALVLDASKVKNEVVVAKKAKKQTGQIRLTNYFISKKSD
jgi:Fanconi anemia group J protein